MQDVSSVRSTSLDNLNLQAQEGRKRPGNIFRQGVIETTNDRDIQSRYFRSLIENVWS